MARRMQSSSESWRAPDGTRYPEEDLVGERLSVRVFPAHFTEEGVPGDPYNCGYACAVRNALAAPWAEIGVTIARIVVPDGKGEWKCIRGMVGKKDREFIDAFDRGEAEVPSNGMLFTLRPIRSSDRKDSKRAVEKRSRKRLIELGKYKENKRPRTGRSLHIRGPFRGTIEEVSSE